MLLRILKACAVSACKGPVTDAWSFLLNQVSLSGCMVSFVMEYFGGCGVGNNSVD
jgi:hypothetical protein